MEQESERRLADERHGFAGLFAGFFLITGCHGDKTTGQGCEAFAAAAHGAPAEEFRRCINEGRDDAIDRDRGDGEQNHRDGGDAEAHANLAIRQGDGDDTGQVGDGNGDGCHTRYQEEEP